MKYQVLFSLKKNETVFMNVICCSRDCPKNGTVWFNIAVMCLKNAAGLPYFFGYKTEFFPFQNNPKKLDPSYKTDLDLPDLLFRQG